MKLKRLSFRVNIHRRSNHWVSVQLHSSRAIMRGILTKIGHKDSSNTNAACWQPQKAIEDSCISEIHLCRDHLSLSTIVHEACHAALHRVHIIGVAAGDKDWQEFICDDTGAIVEGIIAFFDKNKIAVRYAHIPARRLI